MEESCKKMMWICDDCIKSLQLCKPMGCHSAFDRSFCEECGYYKSVWKVVDEKIIEGCYHNGAPCNDVY